MLLPGDISIWARIIIIAIAIPGSILFLLGIQRIFRHIILSGILEGTGGLLLLSISVFGVMLSINLNTYSRLMGESTVARVQFNEKGNDSKGFVNVDFQSRSVYLGGFHREAWQLDARILEWQGLLALIGLKTLCRLQRFSDCYWDAGLENNEPYSAFNSPKEEEGLDLWKIAKKHPYWVPWVRATYGSTEFMPIVHGAVYTVSIDNTGLLVHPDNEIARKAVVQMTFGRELYFTIARIERRHGWIKNALPSLCQRSMGLSDLPLRGGQGKAYWDYKKDIEMITVEFNDKSGKVIQEYYYWNGTLMFVYEDRRKNIPHVSPKKGTEIKNRSLTSQEKQIEENFYYFDNGKMIKWVDKTKKEIDIKGGKFKKAEREIINSSNKLISKFKEMSF